MPPFIMRKPTILCVTESSYLSSGYSTYTHEVLKRLHALDEFNIIEFSSFGRFNDPRIQNIPWTFITNLPNPDNSEEQKIYESNPNNKFGAWKFEEICLRHNPDIVFSFRDFWADSFIFDSPFRDFYHFATMPTADGTPLHTQWISQYITADAVFAYNDWSLEILKEESGKKINTITSAPPGADIDVFKPVPNKNLHKQQFANLPDGSFVIGSTMRNMKRKLYPDIISTFEKFLNEAPEHIKDKTYLYLHTAFPDAGWDFPRLLKEYGVGHRTLFTYFCRNCQESYPSFFQEGPCYCKYCGEKALMFADSSIGVSREALSNIMNCFDIYLQYSVCEGMGMPQVEAASCGVPVFSVDYSAMTDVVRKLNGVPLKLLKMQREAETHRLLAIPDNDFLLEKIIWFLTLPDSLQRRMGKQARDGVLEHYTYDRTAKIWADHFRSIKLKPLSETWNSKSRLFNPNTDFPANLTNEEFIRWGVTNILNRPDKMNSYMAMRLTRDLNWGASTGGMLGLVWNDASALGIDAMVSKERFHHKEAAEALLRTAENFLYWEQKRLEALK